MHDYPLLLHFHWSHSHLVHRLISLYTVPCFSSLFSCILPHPKLWEHLRTAAVLQLPLLSGNQNSPPPEIITPLSLSLYSGPETQILKQASIQLCVCFVAFFLSLRFIIEEKILFINSVSRNWRSNSICKDPLLWQQCYLSIDTTPISLTWALFTRLAVSKLGEREE